MEVLKNEEDKNNELYRKCCLQNWFSDGLDAVYKSWGWAIEVLFAECIGRGMILKEAE